MKAKLINEKLRFEFVEFDYNPESLTVRRESSSMHNAGATPENPGATPSIFLKSTPRVLSGTGYLMGRNVQDRADQLNKWLDPGGGLIGQAIGAVVGAVTGGRVNLAAKLPVLLFQWGTQIMRCVLTDVDTKYERFSAAGSPIRATVRFTVKEEFNIFAILPTNPTSGGQPGRRRHVVIEGENLQTISTASYGRPAMWRGIADINGIDDPFRVRPGSVVYLPNANEVARPAAGQER